MDTRYYNPQLIHGLLRSKLAQECDRMQSQDPHILIYVDGKHGAYYIYNGRLYWDEDTSDGHFGNTDNDGLRADADKLREVVLRYGHNRETKTFLTLEEAIEWATKK